MTPIYNHLYANAARLLLDIDDIAKFSNTIDQYDTTFGKYTDIKLQTDVVIHEMAAIYRELNGELKKYRRQLKHDARLTLTADDIAVLQLKPRPAKYKHAVRPTYAPHNQLVNGLSLSARIAVIKFSKRGTPRARMPERSMRIQRYLAITNSPTPPAMAEYQSIGFSTRARFTLTFQPEQVGKHAHLVTAYETNTGKRGPWSRPLTVGINA